MVKTAVMVSGNGSNLQALIDSKAKGTLSHVELSLVVASKEDSYALTRAKENSIDAVVVSRKKYKDDVAAFERELIPYLQKYDIEMIILAGFLTVFTKDFISIYKDRIINVHPALLPSFGGRGYYGLRLHRAVLDSGVKVSGATIHYVNEDIDSGKIILQKAVDVKEGDTPETLQLRIMQQAEWILLPKAAEMVAIKILEEKNDKH